MNAVVFEQISKLNCKTFFSHLKQFLEIMFFFSLSVLCLSPVARGHFWSRGFLLLLEQEFSSRMDSHSRDSNSNNFKQEIAGLNL